MEKKHRKIGRLEIITIVSLVAIWAALFVSCSETCQGRENNTQKITVTIDSISPYTLNKTNYINNYNELLHHFKILKINNHEYIFYHDYSMAGICHYEDCSYCKTHNKH